MDVERYQPKFGIGAVARITGIPPDTLRIWERRYCVVEPDRGQASRRLYDRADITRLTLIKQLVDQGNAISTVAGLNEDELREKLQVHLHMSGRKPALQIAAAATGGELRVLVYGDALPLLWSRRPPEACGLRLVGAHTSLVDFEQHAARDKPGAVVVEFPSLQKETVTEVRNLMRRTEVERCVVVYGFGAEEALRRLEHFSIPTLRAPVDLADLARVLFDEESGIHSGARDPVIGEYLVKVPPRKFDNKVLGIVANASTAVACECPHHMVDLLYNMLRDRDTLVITNCIHGVYCCGSP